MEIHDLGDIGSFSPDSFEKVNLVDTDRMFVDCWCFEPGQAQEPHTHDDSDKIYLVLEGAATAIIGDEERSLNEGQLVHAGPGVRHGIRNESDRPLRTLVMMAPVPGSSGGHQHDHVSSEPREVAVFTVSSTRTVSDDDSGRTIHAHLDAEGHTATNYEILNDDTQEIRDAVRATVDEVDAIILTGGTGITPDDVTIEAIRPLFDKELDGFGEHLRRLSVDEIGSAVIMSRATAGIVGDTAVFALPGSQSAVDLALEQIVLPELDHVVGLARRSD